MAKGSVNKVILVGRLGKDPEIRYAASGTAVATFSIATTDRVQAGEGNWEDKTEWHRLVAFGKTAERCGNFLNKGTHVYIEGKLQTREWEDNQGTKRYTTEIVLRDFEILGRHGEQGATMPNSGGGSRSSSGPTYGAEPRMEELPPGPSGPDDEIPF